MEKEEIKKIMVIYNDNDFIRVWDWIGKIALMTIKLDVNICNCKILETSNDIENFIKSLLPSAIEFIQYREDKHAEFSRYRNIEKNEIIRLTDSFKNIKFKYNFNEKDEDWLTGGSETLIIDIENNDSYIR